jgi:FlaA1/EpsC-like NDP-sugar epimerase
MIHNSKRIEAAVTGLLQRIVGLDRRAKLFLAVVFDAVLCVVSVIIGFSVRFGEWSLWNPAIATVTVVALVLWLPIFAYRGMYRTVVRFAGSRTMLGIAGSSLIMMAGLAVIFTANSIPGVPRTIAFIQPMIFASLLVFSRLFGRYILFDVLSQRTSSGPRNRVFIYGAGSSGRQLALALGHEPSMVLVGYIDDDDRLTGHHVDGLRVHRSDNVVQLVRDHEVDTILLAIPGVSRRERERIVRRFEEARVRVLTLPAMGELLEGSVSIKDLREIEIEDLLGRDPVPPNQLLLRKIIGGRRVLITGAGGSIGSELCRQIGRLAPECIVLADMSEHALYVIDGELRDAQTNGLLNPSIRIHSELCNVTNVHSMRRLFARFQPQTVFHAAAYKHVPLVEENAVAGLLNNVFGTYHCALEAETAGANHFILVSTDKAVRPTSVMGASKRVCELILQGLNDRGSRTCFGIVRFGNVLGSSGSVVPLFQQQIRQGGPVTLTHRDITRYFMTIPEASQLVIQAGAMAEGGEVFVLDMGEPIRIYDLARTMVHLSGLSVRDEDNPDGDIEINEIGLRKGEKLFEEILIGKSPQTTLHPRIMQAREAFISWPDLSALLHELQGALDESNREKALWVLSRLVPEYTEQAIVRTDVA